MMPCPGETWLNYISPKVGDMVEKDAVKWTWHKDENSADKNKGRTRFTIACSKCENPLGEYFKNSGITQNKNHYKFLTGSLTFISQKP